MVFLDNESISFTYKISKNDEAIVKTDSVHYSLVKGDDTDVYSWNSLIWHIDDFSLVRFYKISFDFFMFDEYSKTQNITDPHFTSFLCFDNNNSQNYLFHFKSIEDIPTSFVENPLSNVFIVRAVWGTSFSDQSGNIIILPEPTIFYMVD